MATATAIDEMAKRKQARTHEPPVPAAPRDETMIRVEFKAPQWLVDAIDQEAARRGMGTQGRSAFLRLAAVEKLERDAPG